MTEPELIKCGRCRSQKLPHFYSIKMTTGIRYKCCDPCRQRCRTAEKIYECEICQFEASSPSTLQYHVDAKHNQIKNFACSKCEYKCATICTLKTHIAAVHDQIRPHQCPECEFKCTLKSTLSSHKKAVHDQIRDQQCPYCDYACSEAGQLRVHIKAVHIQIRDQKCNKCAFSTTTKSLLALHMKTCTGNVRMSSGEFAIAGVLESYRITFEREKRFVDCRDKLTLPFDFYIPSLNIAIEFDGAQHFKPVAYWGGIPGFEANQRRDAIKTTYCAANGIRLLRIKYTDFALIPTLIENFLSSVEESAVDGNHDTINATSNEIGGIEPIQAQNPDLPQ